MQNSSVDYAQRVRVAFEKMLDGNYEIGPLNKFGPHRSAIASVLEKVRRYDDDPVEQYCLLQEIKTDKSEPLHSVFLAGGRSPGPSKLLKFDTADKVEPNLGEIEWLWEGWLPLGQVAVLGAQAGKGKSAFALRLCLSVTTGAGWPDGRRGPDELHKVLWVETERREILNAVRREQFGVPAGMMVTLKARQSFRLDSLQDLEALREAIARFKPRLVVIDSFAAGHSRNENSAAVGRLIQDIESIAADLRVGVLLLHHFRKKPTAKNPERLTIDELRGSSTIGDRAQSIIAIDEPDPVASRGHRRLSHVKCNVAEERPSLGLRWEKNKLEFDFEPPCPKDATSLAVQIGDLLKNLLADGPKRATEIKQKVEAAGFNYHTAKKAKDSLGIKAKKKGMTFYWYLQT